MGWSYGWDSRAELIKHLTDEKEFSGITAKLLAHTARGSVLWSVWEHRYPEGKAGPNGNNPERFIRCDLLEGRSKKHGWGYKDMEESMGPCYYTCPLKYLDMVPDPGGFATEWRAKVREYHAKRARKFQVGEVVELVPGCKPPRVKITAVKPLTGEHDGRLYKVLPRHIA